MDTVTKNAWLLDAFSTQLKPILKILLNLDIILSNSVIASPYDQHQDDHEAGPVMTTVIHSAIIYCEVMIF